jgi:rare lipoprotein A
MWVKRKFGFVSALTIMVMLSGCAEMNLLSYGAKKYNGGSIGSSSSAATTNKDVDRGERKIGKPYQIDGIWYYPAEDNSYDETGIASWYGHPFHGRRTANGAVYDMNKLTAAHKTLPLPTDVRVTNLENGRSIVVTVNDRGPFAHSRIIDLSKRSAELLGIIQKGTAKVRVQLVDPSGNAATQYVAKPETPEEERTNVAAAPQTAIQTDNLAPPPNASAAPNPKSAPLPAPQADKPVQLASATPTHSAPNTTVVTVAPISDTEIFIQAGAFVDYNNANRLSARLSSLGPSKVSQVLVNGQDFYRVRLGPMYGVAQADEMLANLINAGHTNARIIIE